MLTIGELAERTGVAATALRYYDDLGLVRPTARAGGQRRYADDAVRQVGVVLFLRDVGFTLAEVGRLVQGDGWEDVVRAKLDELEQAAADIDAARTALTHALACPAGDPLTCPRFSSIVASRLPAPAPAPAVR